MVSTMKNNQNPATPKPPPQCNFKKTTHALGDAKVDERRLRRDLGLVVRVGELGGEVEAEPWVVLDLGVADLHDERAPAPHGDLDFSCGGFVFLLCVWCGCWVFFG